ncbi:MAG: AAA family ATPase, partial [Cyanobacteria bacterium SZAS LIN-5]|nr:AAA family ATPase [Cyanobacteria bacterium SZAS LIN-5]
MKLFGKNISNKKLLLGVSALSIIGYLGVANFSAPVKNSPAQKHEQIDFPSKFNSNLDDLIARMKQDTAKYSQFIIIENHGRAVQVLLVGKNTGDTLWAPVDPVESAKENAWTAAGALRCTDLTELAKACVQRKTMKDPVEVQEEEEKAAFNWGNALYNLAGWVIPFALVGGLIYWQIKRGGGLGALGGRGKITKAKLELIEPDDKSQRITFADVKGMNRTVDQLRMILTCLKNPERLAELGGMLQKGLLLVGPPGTGKTLLGRAIAGEAEIPFYSIGGADFQEMFVGVGSSRVDDMFKEIEEKVRLTGLPVILFIDEIDALLLTRAGYDGGNSEKGDTVAAFLKKMDGLKALGKVLIIGATNRPEVLDKAATRPGRFGEQIKVLQPNRDGLLDIIHLKLSKVLKKSPDIDPQVLASEFFDSGYTGADVQGIILEQAPILALMRIEQTGAEVMLTMGDIMLAHE